MRGLPAKKSAVGYIKGKVTLSEAARKAELTLWEMEKYLVDNGFKESGRKAVAVPNHKEVDKGTLLEIIRQAGLTKEQFMELV